MSTDKQSVPRFEFTPYGMVETVDGAYVLFANHEKVLNEMCENISHANIVKVPVDIENSQ